jgi:hypothetical protein
VASPSFADGRDRIDLELTDTQRYSSGVLLQVYRPNSRTCGTLRVRFKTSPGRADDYSMTIHSLSLIGDTPSDTASPSVRPDHDYSRYTDEQLIAERERRMRRQLQPVLHGTPPSSHGSSIGADADVDRITQELIRRARSRHPSSFRPEV